MSCLPLRWVGGRELALRWQQTKNCIRTVHISPSQTCARTHAPQHENSVSCFFHASSSGKHWWFPTTSCFRSSVISKAIQIKYIVSSACFPFAHSVPPFTKILFSQSLVAPHSRPCERLGTRCHKHAGSSNFSTDMHFPCLQPCT